MSEGASSDTSSSASSSPDGGSVVGSPAGDGEASTPSTGPGADYDRPSPPTSGHPPPSSTPPLRRAPSFVLSPDKVRVRPEDELEANEALARGNLALFQSQLETQEVTAATSRRLARLHFKLWAMGLRKSAIEDTREAYQAALAFEENQSRPQLWVETAQVYVSFGAYDGAATVLDRVALDFAAHPMLPTVNMLRGALWRKTGRAEDFIPILYGMAVADPPRGYTNADIMFLLAWSYEVLASEREAAGHPEAATSRALADAGFRDCWSEATGLKPKRATDMSWVPWRNDPHLWIDAAQTHVAANNHILACECFVEALRLRATGGAPDADIDWRSEKPVWMLATRCAVRAGDEAWGDAFGQALMRSLGARAANLGSLMKEVSSRDLGMLRHAGGVLARRIEQQATMLVAGMLLALRRRARRNTAARRIQTAWRWRHVTTFLVWRRDARRNIQRVMRGWMGRLKVRRMHRASSLIVGLWRMWRDRAYVRGALVDRREWAVAVLHRAMPCMGAMGFLNKHRRAAKKIQATFRMYQCKLLIVLMRSNREAVVARLRQAAGPRMVGSVVMPGELVRQYLPSYLVKRKRLVRARAGTEVRENPSLRPELDTQMTVESMWGRARDLKDKLDARFRRRRAKGDRRRKMKNRAPYTEAALMDVSGFGGSWDDSVVFGGSTGGEGDGSEGTSDDDGGTASSGGLSSTDGGTTTEGDEEELTEEAKAAAAARAAAAAKTAAEEERRQLRRLTRRNRRRQRRNMISRKIDTSVLTNVRPDLVHRVRRPKPDATLASHVAYCMDSGSETDDGAPEAPGLLAVAGGGRDPSTRVYDKGGAVFEFSSEEEEEVPAVPSATGPALDSETDSVSSFSDESDFDLDARGSTGAHVFNAIDTALGRTAVRGGGMPAPAPAPAATWMPPVLPPRGSSLAATNRLSADRALFRSKFQDKKRVGLSRVHAVGRTGRESGWGKPASTAAPKNAPAAPRPNTTCTFRKGVGAADARFSYVGPMRSILLEALLWVRVEPSAWRELLQRRLESVEKLAVQAHHAACTRSSCDVLWRLGRMLKLSAKFATRPATMVSAIKECVRAWETEWEACRSAEDGAAAWDGVPTGLYTPAPDLSVTAPLSPPSSMMQPRGPGSGMLPPLADYGPGDGPPPPLSTEAASLDPALGLHPIAIYGSELTDKQLMLLAQLRAYYNRMMFEEINKRQWHSAGDVLNRILVERDMTPTYNTLLSILLGLQGLTSGNTKKPSEKAGQFPDVACTVADLDKGVVDAAVDTERLRNPGDLVLCVVRHATALGFLNGDMALEGLKCLPVCGGWWHVGLAWRDMFQAARLEMSKPLRKAFIAAAKSIDVPMRHKLYRYLVSVDAPYKLAKAAAHVGLETDFEKTAAQYGFDTSKAAILKI